MDHCETVKVKPWGGYQGEYVLINAADFDPKVHTLADAPGREAAKPTAKPAPKPRAKRGK